MPRGPLADENRQLSKDARSVFGSNVYFDHVLHRGSWYGLLSIIEDETLRYQNRHVLLRTAIFRPMADNILGLGSRQAHFSSRSRAKSPSRIDGPNPQILSSRM